MRELLIRRFTGVSLVVRSGAGRFFLVWLMAVFFGRGWESGAGPDLVPYANSNDYFSLGEERWASGGSGRPPDDVHALGFAWLPRSVGPRDGFGKLLAAGLS